MCPDSAPLRYAILRHEGIRAPHFDLLFETAPGSPLAAWRSRDWPVRPDTPLIPLPDHRRQYLTYEGPVSNRRGTVERVASGTHAIRESAPDRLVVALDDGHSLRLPRASE